ncbi:MAG: energy transducer TonB [Paludibacteraceae bacterium]|nr:energy transducer TonB [Paludibacteraceae bacterium]
MTRGKRICELLKKVRQQIAEANGIAYAPRECTHKGDCAGTCPACEAERGYLESQLNKRVKMGESIKIVGLSMALLSGAACSSETNRPQNSSESSPLEMEYENKLESCPTVGKVQVEEVAKDSGRRPMEIVEYGESIEKIDLGEIVPPTEDFDDVEGDITVALPTTRAEFPGGNDSLFSFLKEHLQYPAHARNEKIFGRVVVSFAVATDGSISDVKVERSVHPYLDREAVRVVTLMPKWIPAKEGEMAVRSRFTLPINFKE